MWQFRPPYSQARPCLYWKSLAEQEGRLCDCTSTLPLEPLSSLLALCLCDSKVWEQFLSVWLRGIRTSRFGSHTLWIRICLPQWSAKAKPTDWFQQRSLERSARCWSAEYSYSWSSLSFPGAIPSYTSLDGMPCFAVEVRWVWFGIAAGNFHWERTRAYSTQKSLLDLFAAA